VGEGNAANIEESTREDGRAAHRRALGSLARSELVEIHRAVGLIDLDQSQSSLADAISNRLAAPRGIEPMIAELPVAARFLLGLCALADTVDWPSTELELAVRAAGFAPRDATEALRRLGLLVIGSSARDQAPAPSTSIVHPSALSVARTVLPAGAEVRRAGPVRQVRQADGLEPILRLATLWQRVKESPLRQTQQRQLFKRDLERLEEDGLLIGPIADALEPIPNPVGLWLGLGRAIGLLEDDATRDGLVAAPASFWAEHGVHLPHMVSTRWLGLREWTERPDGPATRVLRPVLLLWLATLRLDEWAAVDDLAAVVDGLVAGWDRPASDENGASARRRQDSSPREAARNGSSGTVSTLLLGPAYQLGLVRAAEEAPGGRRVVQLTDLGRYVLAIGPPPAPSDAFEKYLVVQPNFEAIAYRQGLTPRRIGELSQFARWTQLGAALGFELTPESVYRGLEGGMAIDELIGLLNRHGVRALPAGVNENVRGWAERRQRVTFHKAATLIEFASAEARATALAGWPAHQSGTPVAVGDCLLLVEDERAIPFERFRLTGARDYRRPPEVCVEVERDGITLALDVARSDLFVESELARFASELPAPDRSATIQMPRRRYRITRESIARGLDHGLTADSFAKWFARRTGDLVPAATRLLLYSHGGLRETVSASRPVLLRVPKADVLDGLLQHPATRDHLADRLGPTTITLRPGALESLRAALLELGIAIEVEPST
jgi:hypothetical protein